MRIIALDYGKARIGIATTDETNTIAYPYKTVKTKKTLELTCEYLLEELKEILSQTKLILLGHPLLLDGNKSEMTLEVEKFYELLKKKTEIPIELVNEVLSSEQAKEHLQTNLKMNRKKRSKILDPMAATIILQDYLSSN